MELSGDSSGKASDSGNIVYAPNADVNLSGSGTLIGSVISNSLRIGGGGKIINKDIDLGGIPFFPGGNDSKSNAKVDSLMLRESSK